MLVPVGSLVSAGAGDFYSDTLPTLDEAYLRPRYNGYIPFQDKAGELVHAYLRDGGDPRRTLDDMNRYYRESRADERS
jgi:multiple sugar transport system substrate-binding protein